MVQHHGWETHDNNIHLIKANGLNHLSYRLSFFDIQGSQRYYLLFDNIFHWCAALPLVVCQSFRVNHLADNYSYRVYVTFRRIIVPEWSASSTKSRSGKISPATNWKPIICFHGGHVEKVVHDFVSCVASVPTSNCLLFRWLGCYRLQEDDVFEVA